MAPNMEKSFWQRMGLGEASREVCMRAVREAYSGCEVEEFRNQGYCSFTLLISQQGHVSIRSDDVPEEVSIDAAASIPTPKRRIVQLRPEQHTLDLTITCAASETYGALAPNIHRLGCNLPPRLHAFEMDLVAGVPYSHLQPRVPTRIASIQRQQITLVQSFASFISKAWPSAPSSTSRAIRADSPIDGFDTTSMLSQCAGKVGSCITSKLDKLSRELPDTELRERAAVTLSKMKQLEDFPVVLNHGDLIPSNILVDANTWMLSGVVDWAEAEYLPFGTCLYGLEHLLGYLDYTESPPKFRYYDDDPRLRDVFWGTLCEEAPEMEDRMEEVKVARDLGVFLWYGYAWDEGKIDRVVNEEDDAIEVECLRAFLGCESSE